MKHTPTQATKKTKNNPYVEKKQNLNQSIEIKHKLIKNNINYIPWGIAILSAILNFIGLYYIQIVVLKKEKENTMLSIKEERDYTLKKVQEAMAELRKIQEEQNTISSNQLVKMKTIELKIQKIDTGTNVLEKKFNDFSDFFVLFASIIDANIYAISASRNTNSLQAWHDYIYAMKLYANSMHNENFRKVARPQLRDCYNKSIKVNPFIINNKLPNDVKSREFFSVVRDTLNTIIQNKHVDTDIKENLIRSRDIISSTFKM